MPEQCFGGLVRGVTGSFQARVFFGILADLLLICSCCVWVCAAQVKSFKQGKTALRGAVAMAVRNATMADAAAGGASGGAAGGDKAGADAKGAATSGPMTRNARWGRGGELGWEGQHAGWLG